MATTRAIAIAIPAIMGHGVAECWLPSRPATPVGTTPGLVSCPGGAMAFRFFLLNSTTNGVTITAMATRTPRVFAHQGKGGRGGSSVSGFFFRSGRAMTSTRMNATTAMPSPAATRMARTDPVTPAAAECAARENVPCARSPATVTASSTATAATRVAPPVRPAAADPGDRPGRSRMAHPLSRRRCLSQLMPRGERRPSPAGRAYGSGWSGNPHVVVLPRELPLPLGQVRLADRDDQAPVMADWAALHPRHHQVQRLELHAGNPDRGEHVPLAAPYDDIGAELVAEQPRDGGSPGDHADGDHNRR